MTGTRRLDSVGGRDSTSLQPARFYGDLPLVDDLFKDGPWRSRVTATFIATTMTVIWLAAPEAWSATSVFPIIDLTLMIILAASATVFTISRIWEHRPDVISDLSLIYEVVCCFAIGLAEQAIPWPDDYLVRGTSWISLLIVMFPLSVPSTAGKAFIAATAGASMGPFALLIFIASGSPTPPLNLWVHLFLPTYLAAAVAWALATMVYRLNKNAKEGRQLGSYELIEPLGHGGMGEVWRARHQILARPAAIKLVRPQAVATGGGNTASTILRRFEREAQATAALTSPNTISLYDFGISRDGTFYYVMELLDGVDLETLVKRFGPQPAARVIFILEQICSSLAEAHQHGLIHRDVKPANIYLCRLGLTLDFVKVLDFGLVTFAPGSAADKSHLTATGSVSGTPAFMAPEMTMEDHEVDARADIYALGCVAYWLLTGRLVFERDSAVQVMMAHIQATPEPPSLYCEDGLPIDLDRLIMSCLEKDPAKRPESAVAFREQLSHIVCGEWTEGRRAAWWATHLAVQR